MTAARVRSGLVLAYLAALAAVLLVLAFGGFAKAEDFYDENGNQITEEEFYAQFGDDVEVPVEDVPDEATVFLETDPQSRQDGF